jgi:hypothetical protein
MQRSLPILTLILCFVTADVAFATQSHMLQLPTSSAFRCLNCHAQQDPVASNATLNVFGLAFKNNGSRWDHTLAVKRSDDDSCTNGFELGDEDGDGRPDTGVTRERSNPGQSDCTLELRPQAWSALKTLFR